MVGGEGHHAAVIAIHHRNGAAPVTLTRHTPIPQTICHLACAQFVLREMVYHFLLCVFHSEPVEKMRIDESSIPRPAIVRRLKRWGFNHWTNRQTIESGEFVVALIVRGTPKNRPCAILHEDEIGDIQRQVLPIHKGVRIAQSGVIAFFVGGGLVLFFGGGLQTLLDELGEFGIFVRQLFGERMGGGEGEKGRAKQCIGAGGEDINGGLAFVTKMNARARAFANPVFLHVDDFGRPCAEARQIIQQFLAIAGDSHEPLGEFFLLHIRPRPPASAVYDLFIGEDALFNRVPIDDGFLAIQQIVCEKVQKHFLLVLVVIGMTAGDFARPVVAKAHALQLGAHGGDVVISPVSRVGVFEAGGVFGGQTERVPSHGMQHGVSLHFFQPRHYVPQRVIPHMTHVNPPRRIRKHL